MKIAIIADPELPVPPLLYGGIERIIALLIEGYVRSGHEVSLFAHRDSRTSAKLFAYKGVRSESILDTIKNSILINNELFNTTYDIVHSFGRLAYLMPQLPFRLPKLMSYQREPTISQVKRAKHLARRNSLAFTGCSNYISDQIAPFVPSYTIFNGVDLNKYDFQPIVEDDAPLMFLGRIEPIKGPHIAIQIAKRLRKNLIIAGNIPVEYQDYFNNEIRSELNEDITYIGPVDDKAKNEFLRKSCALLMPIEWNEPFGIVMIEAMACGTPAIAFNRGSVNEVIRDGINGFKCKTIAEMETAIGKLNEIDRIDVRRDCEERFSSQVIIEQYLNLYNTLKTKCLKKLK